MVNEGGSRPRLAGPVPTGLVVSVAALTPWLPWADRFAESVPPALPVEAVFLRLALAGALAAAAIGSMHPAWRTRALVVIGVCAACATFEALVGLRIVDPHEVEWIMHGKDARWYYLDFEFFRREPWTWPPGRIKGLLYPVGTSVGNTDSLPLVSLPLKLVSAWLPEEFQFLGAWMLASLALQGAFAALLVRSAGGSWPYQLVGLFFFLLSPFAVPSVERAGLHTSRWLTLAALWLYVRPPRQAGRELSTWAILVGVAGLTHPYTCVMVVPLGLAFYARRSFVDRTMRLSIAASSLVVLALLLGGCWTIGGYFDVSDLSQLNGGLGYWSMNLLAPINPMEWRSLLPSLPTATSGQYEGFQYLGGGVLLLVVLSVVVLIWRRPSRANLAQWAPLSMAAVFLTVLALSPKVTAGSRVLFEWPAVLFAPFRPFRSSGRLFLPVVWILTYVPLRILARRLPSAVAWGLAVLALYVQWLDLGPNFEKNHLERFAAGRHQWERVISADDLHFPGRSIHKMLFVPNDGWRSDEDIPLIFAASHRGIGVSGGHASRVDGPRLVRSRKALQSQFEHGPLDEDAIYAVAPTSVDEFKRRFPVDCRTAGPYTLCVAVRPRGP